MLIHRLHLENFCQHRSLDVNLTAGLNMLAGPNGSGKTNILRALQLALIGDAGGDRPKADDIFQGIAAGEESYVEVELSHSNIDMTIRRSLRPSGNLLTIGNERWQSVGEINTELCRRLGATKRQIADYIFVRQRKIDEMFDQRPADRAASLASLFGVEHAERVHKKMGEFISAIQVPTTTLDEDTLLAKLRDQEQSLIAVDGEIAALDMPEDPAACVHSQQQIINRHAALVTAEAKMSSLAADIVGKRRTVANAAQAITELDAAIMQKAADITSVAAVCEMATEGIQQWRTFEASSAMRVQWRWDTDRAVAERDRLQVPIKPDCEPLTAEQESELQELVKEQHRLSAGLEGLREDDVCPTCGQQWPDAEAIKVRRTRLQAEYEAVGEAWSALSAVSNKWREYNREKATYDDRHQRVEETLERLRQAGQSLVNLDQPAEAMEVYTAILAEREQFKLDQQELTTRRQQRAVTLAKLEGEVGQLDSNLAAAVTERAAMPEYTAEQCKAAVRLRDTVLANQRVFSELQRRRAVAAASIETTVALIESARTTKQKGQKTVDVIAHLTAVRSVFHRNEAPHMVAYTYVEQMLGEVNTALEIFEAPFRVEMDESCGFTARFLDGVRVQSDRRLSVGERIILAMAFRITVNSTFAGQVGVLIMDEPTAGLDEHNLGSLPRALDRLRELSHERGLQVLFVTHEPRISHHFDNTIELSAA